VGTRKKTFPELTALDIEGRIGVEETSKCGQASGGFTTKQEVEVLEASDNIISTLSFANPCPIRLEIGVDRVSLYIGQRDMQWSRYTKEHIASGTAVAPDEPAEEHEETVEEVHQSKDDAYNEAVEAAGGEDKVTA
jgi:hypothetical protein